MSSVFVLCNLLQKWVCYACPKFWKFLPECTVLVGISRTVPHIWLFGPRNGRSNRPRGNYPRWCRFRGLSNRNTRSQVSVFWPLHVNHANHTGKCSAARRQVFDEEDIELGSRRPTAAIANSCSLVVIMYRIQTDARVITGNTTEIKNRGRRPRFFISRLYFP